MTAQTAFDAGEPDLPEENARSIMVLLIDDQPLVGEAIRRALQGEPGIDFHFCSNPLDALTVAKTVQPTVILQDLVMPGISGLDLVTEYRRDAVTRNIPIIVLSTKEEASIKSDAFRLGANDYLVKLPDRIELVARIRYHAAAYLAYVQRNEAYRALRKSQQELLETNLELQRLTNVDGLTGLSNRRYFSEYFETEWRSALRVQEPISLLMVDVDHFKQYNDTYGHLAGDAVLRTIAQSLKAMVKRPRDLAVRMGGEEFVVVLPQTPANDVLLIANRAVQAVSALNIAHQASATADRVTISVGAATCIPIREVPSRTLIEAADKAMYEAKQSGRNRAVGAPPNLGF